MPSITSTSAWSQCWWVMTTLRTVRLSMRRTTHSLPRRTSKHRSDAASRQISLGTCYALVRYRACVFWQRVSPQVVEPGRIMFTCGHRGIVELMELRSTGYWTTKLPVRQALRLSIAWPTPTGEINSQIITITERIASTCLFSIIIRGMTYRVTLVIVSFAKTAVHRNIVCEASSARCAGA